MKVTERTVNLISYLAEQKSPQSLSEIGRQLGIGKSALHRMLACLEGLGWVTWDSQTGKYNLGTKALEVGSSMVSRSDIRSVSLPHLYQISDVTRETATLSLRLGVDRVYLEQIEGKYEVRQVVEIGKRFPLWLGAPGKAILAFTDSVEADKVINEFVISGTRVLASGQVMTAEMLRKELDEVRREGFATSVGERVPGSTSVAAPIFGRNHQVVGALAVAGPLPRFNLELARGYGALVSQAATKVSQQLGGLLDVQSGHNPAKTRGGKARRGGKRTSLNN